MRIAREYLGSTRVKSVERRAKRCIIRPADGRAESCLTLLETQLPRKNEVFRSSRTLKSHELNIEVQGSGLVLRHIEPPFLVQPAHGCQRLPNRKRG